MWYTGWQGSKISNYSQKYVSLRGIRSHNMKNQTLLLSILCLLSAILLSIPFLVPHTGAAALFAFLPLLAAERVAYLTGRKRFWVFHYSTFVLWNAFTTFWVCNATVGGGVFAVLANALQMSVVFGVFRLSRRVFRGSLPYIFLACAWIAWERFYFSAQISWPWLTLGNSFARTLSLCQWYEITGSLGGSLWIWACNLSLFGIICALSDGSFTLWNSKAKGMALGMYALLLVGPMVASGIMYRNYEEKEDPLEVFIAQPNLDPYQKFQSLTQDQQNAILCDLLVDGLKDRKVSPVDTAKYEKGLSSPILALFPETCTSDIVATNISESRTFRRFSSLLSDYPGVNLLFGATSREYFQGKERPSETVYKVGEDLWLQSHNSAVMTDGTARSEIFHKSKLVVGVEKTPYPAFFRRLDDLLGGVMGRDIGQKEISDLTVRSYSGDGSATETPVGCAICYESVYGDYCRGYIQKGARCLAIITNDAWWGNTPGYRQHLSYASLRAIETRRSIARCANTGISAIINQRGDITQQSSWWERQTLRGSVNLSDYQTFFVRTGDVPGKVCSLVFILLFLYMIVGLITSKGGRRS